MQNDDVIWSIINNSFCSFKTGCKDNTLCRNQYNVTGLCNRHSCPLANSQYATVKEEEGIRYLYMKTVERAAFPSRMWEKVKLSHNYERGLQQIDEYLQYWDKWMIHKCKQRYTKITQYLIRMRKMAQQPQKKLVPVVKRRERLDLKREKKALRAARIDTAIESELLERLKKGTYGDMYNFSEKVYEKAIREGECISESEDESYEEMDAMQDSDAEEMEDTDSEVEYVAEDEVEFSDMSDMEDIGEGGSDDSDDSSSSDEDTPKPKKARSSRPHVEIEYETESQPSTSRAKVPSF